MIKPKIHFENITIKEMENTDGRFYILSCFERRFKINRLSYDMIMLMDGTRDFEEISNLLNREKKPQEIENIYNEEFVKMGIVEGCIPVQKNEKRFLYWKIRLLDVNSFKSFHALDFLFQRKMYVLLLFVNTFVLFLGVNIFGNELFNISKIKIVHLLICIVLVYLSGFLHEIGHCLCAGKYCTLEKGAIGIAIYIISLVWYIDLNSVWHLDKSKKLHINYAGVYLQNIYLSFLMLLSFSLSDKILFLLAAVVSITAYLNFVPFVKYDGYWILVDYFDFPNLLNYTIQKYLYKFKIIKMYKTRKLTERQIQFFNIYSFGFLVYIILFISFILWNLIQSIFKIFSTVCYGECMTLYSIWLIVRVIFSLLLIFKAISVVKENIYILKQNY